LLLLMLGRELSNEKRRVLVGVGVDADVVAASNVDVDKLRRHSMRAIDWAAVAGLSID
jgi:hypothetical protein